MTHSKAKKQGMQDQCSSTRQRAAAATKTAAVPREDHGFAIIRSVRFMSITLHIPDSIAQSLRLPEGEVEQRLRQELAVALYAKGLLSLGKASELAGTSRLLFAEILTQGNIARHYGEKDLTEDIKYAGGE
jgi:predicted HTH domain antitoxin